VSHKNEWQHAAHAGAHLLKHTLQTEQGKQAVRAVAGTAVAVATTVPVLLPLVAATGLFWWLSKK
jgi:hypothetical protein